MKNLFSFALLLCLVCSSLIMPAAAADGGVEEFNDIAQSIVAMDPDVSQEQIDSLLAQLEALDLDGEEDQNELTGSMVGNPENQSIQMLFAQLQLQLAQSSKEQAANQLDAIRAAQEQSAQITDYIYTARELQSSARNNDIKPVPQDMLQFLQSNSLYIPSNPNGPTVSDWDAIIQSLENFQGTVDSNMQMQMVYIQDYMEQYNQYSSQSSSLLESYFKQGLSGSATMLGMGGAGLAVTALVVGLAVGSLVTALLLRRKQSA